ncbi:hypothetical protein E2C01_093229 [Portunus trituberculatus]|uniref:Uncharacterized protein n=1 Tax=Portunus trituberculatus TaxID=210409 RepID=A0A5B7JIH0_PORTR|nr:hypothetical protein [Portunus trituberculatus]
MEKGSVPGPWEAGQVPQGRPSTSTQTVTIKDDKIAFLITVSTKQLNMKLVILAALLGLTLAAPEYINGAPPLPEDDSSSEEDNSELVPILKYDRIQEEDGRFNVDVETGNGILLSESGAPKGPDGAVVKAGQYS